MKKIAVLSFSAIMFAACGGTTTTVNTNVSTNRSTAVTNAPATTTPNNSLVVSSHSSDQNSSVKPNQSSMEQQNSPMAKPIDVTEMTAKIEKADKDFKAKPDDDKLKKALADAYFERAFALTKAAQYRPALGDFRKGLKLNPEDKEAQSMHDQIIEIFKSIGREPPKEGEEPAPLPFKKS